jgi:two-component system chemotaxis response regulator CheY
MKALVVDDDIVSRMALIDLLSVYGVFDLVEAEDGEAAWTKLEAGLRPVICFCDVRMPRMSGIDLLQKMKGRPDLAKLPFVLVSSASDRETVLQAVTLGAVGYILKPLHAADARAHLEKIFKVTLDKLAEDPVATAQRLNIGSERLQAYLGAFGAQLAAGRKELDALLAAGKVGDALLRVDAFHTGCLTLGLWQAAAALDAARQGVSDSVRLEAAIDSAADALRRQGNRMRATSAMLGSGALA